MAIAKEGSGTLILSGNNTFNGGVAIKKGTVQLETSANAAGTGTITLGNTTGTDSATLLVATTGLTIANPIALATNATAGTLTIGNTGTAISTIFSGGVTGTNSFTINTNATTGTIEFSTATVNNTGTITHIGAGSGDTTISSVIGSNVTGIIQNSSTSKLVLSGNNSSVGYVTISSGTLELSGTTNLNVSGNWVNSGIFTANQSTVTLNGSSAQTIISGGTGTGKNFYNITINNTSGGVSLLTNDLTQATGGVLAFTKGTLNLNGKTWTLGADFAPAPTSAVELDINGGTLNGGTDYNMTLSDSDMTIIHASGIVNCHDFALTAGTYTCSGNAAINASGNVTITSTWTNTGSTITMSGSDKTIDASQALNNLTIDGSVSVVNNDLNVTGSLIVNSDKTLDIGAKSLAVSGTLTNNGTIKLVGAADQTVTAITGGTVIYIGNGTYIGLRAGYLYYNLIFFSILGTGNWTLADDLIVNNNLIITSGTLISSTYKTTVNGYVLINGGTFNASNAAADLDFNGNFKMTSGTLSAPAVLDNTSFTVAGNWEISGSGIFLPNNGRVVLDAGTTGKTIMTTSTGACAFYDVRFDNANGGWTLSDDLTVNSGITIAAGTLDVSASDRTLYVGGNWTNAGAFNAQSGTVVFNGTAAQTITAGGTGLGKTFFNMTITNASAAGIIFADSCTITGTFTDTTAGSKLTFNAGSTYAFANINISGTENSLIIMQSSAADEWFFNVSQTSPVVSYAEVSYSDASGGSTIDGTNGCVDANYNKNWIFPNIGITVSGTSNSAGTVWIAVNGSRKEGRAGTIIDSVWLIAFVKVNSGDIVTVWINNPATGNESTAVVKYSGSGNIIGIVLDKHTLSVGSASQQSLTIADMSLYTHSDNADVMHGVSSGVLTVDAGGTFTDAKIKVLSGITFTIGSTETLNTHDVEIAGTLIGTSTATFNVSGDWVNNNIFTAGNSTVNFNGTDTQIINAGSSSFYNVTVNNGSTNGVKLAANTVLVIGTNGILTINTGKRLDLNGAGLTVTGASFVNSGTLQLQGNETLLDFVNDTANNGTVKYTGTGTYTGLKAGYNYANLIIDAGTYNTGDNYLHVLIGFNNNGTIVVTTGDVTLPRNPTTGKFKFTVARDLPGYNYTNLELSASGSYTIMGDCVFGTLNMSGNGTLTIIPYKGDDTGVTTDTLQGSGTIVTQDSGAKTVLPAGANVTFTSIATALPGNQYSVLILQKGGSAQGDITADRLDIGTGRTLNMNTRSLAVYTTLNNNGTIVVGAGTLSLPTGVNAGNFTFTDTNDIPGSAYATLTVNAAAKTLTALDDITAANLTVIAGALNIGSHDLAAGSISNSGTIKLVGTATQSVPVITTGTVEYTGSDSYTGLRAGNYYNALKFSGAGSYALDNNLTVTGALEISNASGILDIGGRNLAAGSVSNSGTIKLVGAAAQSVNSITTGTVEYTGSNYYTGLRAGNIYGALKFSGTGTYVLDNNLSVTNALTVSNTSGILDIGTNNLAAGSVANSGTIKLVGAAAQSVSNIAAGTVEYTGTSNYTGLKAGYSYVNLIIDSGNYNITTNDLSVSGSFINNGTITVSTGNVTNIPAGNAGSFTFTANNTVPSRTYNTLALDGIDASFIAAGGIITASTLNVTNGVFNLSNNNASVIVSGDLTIDSGGAVVKGSSGTWTFNGSGSASWIDSTVAGQDLGNVSIAGNNKTVVANSNVKAASVNIASNSIFDITGHTLTLTGTGTGQNAPLIKNGSLLIDNSTVKYTGAGSDTDIAAIPYNNLMIWPGASTTYYLAGDLAGLNKVLGVTTLGGAVTLDAGLVTNYNLQTDGITINSGARYMARGSNIVVTDDWTNYGTFTCGSSKVVLDGVSTTAQFVTTGGADSKFNILEIETMRQGGGYDVVFVDALHANVLYLGAQGYESDKTFAFATGTANVHTINSVFTTTGCQYKIIRLVPVNSTETWYLNAPDNANLSYTDIKNSFSVNDIYLTNSHNAGGNNAKWHFTAVTSCGTGNWGNTASWTTGYVPTEYDLVMISDGILSLSEVTTVAGITINSGKTLTLGGHNLTAAGGITNYGNLILNGSEEITGAITNAAGSTVKYCGAGTYEALKAGTTYNNLEFANAAGIWKMNSNLTVSGALNITSGTVNLNGKIITVTGGIVNSGGLIVNGNETLSGAVTNKSGSTVTYNGSGTFDQLKCGNSYSNLVFNGSAIWTPNCDIVVTGTLEIVNGTLKGSNNTIKVSGNFTVNGQFLAENSTVVFDDASKVSYIHGTTFTNLSITTPGKTVVIDAGLTETITGTLTITGTSGQPVTLLSGTTGTQWNINPQGTINISNIQVRDSNNIGRAISVPYTANLGNNTGWTFIYPSHGGSINTNTPQINNSLFLFRYGSSELPLYTTASDLIITPSGAAMVAPAAIGRSALAPATAFGMHIPGINYAFMGVTGSAILQQPLPPNAFMGVTGSATLPQLMPASAFAGVTGTALMPATLSQSVFNGVQAGVQLPPRVSFDGVQPTAQLPARVSFDGMESMVQLPARISFEGVQPAVHLPKGVSFAGIQPTAQLPERVSFAGAQPTVQLPDRISFEGMRSAAQLPARVSFDGVSPAIQLPEKISFAGMRPAVQLPERVSFEGAQPAVQLPPKTSFEGMQSAVQLPAQVSFEGMQPTAQLPEKISFAGAQPAAQLPERVTFEGMQPTAQLPEKISFAGAQPAVQLPPRTSFEGIQPTVQLPEKVSFDGTQSTAALSQPLPKTVFEGMQPAAQLPEKVSFEGTRASEVLPPSAIQTLKEAAASATLPETKETFKEIGATVQLPPKTSFEGTQAAVTMPPKVSFEGTKADVSLPEDDR
ncbi:MAG: autotransporter-associated beta strand repeat-containing protein [Candidatus Omnitrophota bacterium]